MDAKLLILANVCREKFEVENFVEKNDILMLLESGSFFFESENGRYTVRAGECVNFRCNVFYHRETLEPVKLHLFRYDADEELFPCEHLVFRDRERILSTARFVGELAPYTARGMEWAEHFFFDIVNQYMVENFSSPLKREKRDAVIEAAIGEMKARIYENLSPKQISFFTTDLSYVQFLRRFKAYTGMTPSDYMIGLRLHKAQSLLLGTPMSIKEISEKCGFENEYYFSNFFKKHFHVSPSAFRKMVL